MVIFINIGEFCFWTFLLKTMNKRYDAYPFDWMFSNLSFVIEQIDTDFDQFNKMINQMTKDSFKNYETECFKRPSIPHKNLNILEDRQYYVRCILRFQNILQSENQIIFLHIDGQLNKHNEHINLFNKYIKNKYPNLKYLIITLCFKQNKSILDNYIFEKKNDMFNIFYWTFYLKESSPDLGNWFAYASDPILINKIEDLIKFYD
ncbi:Papain cysteine peptidase (DUF1796) [uncultured virus]|nr:Papain cysteine peptidase (DUF1796) [uncultured virus]